MNLTKSRTYVGQYFHVMVTVAPWMELGSGDGLQPFINIAKRAVAEGIYKKTEQIINLDRVECDVTPDPESLDTIILCRHPIHIHVVEIAEE